MAGQRTGVEDQDVLLCIRRLRRFGYDARFGFGDSVCQRAWAQEGRSGERARNGERERESARRLAIGSSHRTVLKASY